MRPGALDMLDRYESQGPPQLRAERDRGTPPAGVARARRLPHPRHRRGRGGRERSGRGQVGRRGVHQALGALHLWKHPHRPRAQLRDRRRLRALPARARRERAVRVRLRRLRAARRAGRNRRRGVAQRVGEPLRHAHDRPAGAAGVLLRLGAHLHELRPEHVPLVAVALPHTAEARADLPRGRNRGLVRHLPDHPRDDPGGGWALLALPQPSAPDPATGVVPARERVRGGERSALGGAGELGRHLAGEPALRAGAGGWR